MNVFIAVLLVFAMIGLIDRMQGNKWGTVRDFDMGLSTMGAIAIPVSGIYCIGITVIKRYAETISQWTEGFLIDPSIIIGCLLAPDLGAPFLTVELSSNLALGYFSGVVVAGCLGQFISFQLPVLISTLEEKGNFNNHCSDSKQIEPCKYRIYTLKNKNGFRVYK